MAAELTINDYPFLKELGIEAENKGAYMGEWLGNGPAITAVNPSNGKAIAIVHGVRVIFYFRSRIFRFHIFWCHVTVFCARRRSCSVLLLFFVLLTIGVIASQASTDDYNKCIKAMEDARAVWQAVRIHFSLPSPVFCSSSLPTWISSVSPRLSASEIPPTFCSFVFSFSFKASFRNHDRFHRSSKRDSNYLVSCCCQ